MVVCLRSQVADIVIMISQYHTDLEIAALIELSHGLGWRRGWHGVW